LERDSAGNGFLTLVSAIAAGRTHSLALKSDGTVFAWSSNNFGSSARATAGRSARSAWCWGTTANDAPRDGDATGTLSTSQTFG